MSQPRTAVRTCTLLCASRVPLHALAPPYDTLRHVSYQTEIKHDRFGPSVPCYGFVGMFDLVTGPYLVLIMERQHVGKIRSHDIWKAARVSLFPCTSGGAGSSTPEQIRAEQGQLKTLVRICARGALHRPLSRSCALPDVKKRTRLTPQIPTDGSHERGRAVLLLHIRPDALVRRFTLSMSLCAGKVGPAVSVCPRGQCCAHKRSHRAIPFCQLAAGCNSSTHTGLLGREHRIQSRYGKGCESVSSPLSSSRFTLP